MSVQFKQWIGTFILSISLAGLASAQTATDAIMMGKGQICIAVPFGYDSWSSYWEGDLKRENENLGTVSYRSVQPGFALGLHKRIDLLAGIAWVSNRPSTGVFAAETGFQDVSLAIKAKAYERKIGPGTLSILATLGFSTPLVAYKPDYLPFARGAGSTNGNGRAIVSYILDKGFYLTAQYGYTQRSNIEIDRNYYYTDKAYYTNEVDLPNTADWSVSLGYFKNRIKAVASYTGFNTLGGTDIRRNDMPFPSNNMDAQRVNGVVQYYFSKPKGLGLIAMGAYTLNGRNVGQAWSAGGGITYQFGLWGKTDN